MIVAQARRDSQSVSLCTLNGAMSTLRFRPHPPPIHTHTHTRTRTRTQKPKLEAGLSRWISAGAIMGSRTSTASLEKCRLVTERFQCYDFPFCVSISLSYENSKIVTQFQRYDLTFFVRNKSGTAPNKSMALKSLHDSHGKACRALGKPCGQPTAD